MVRTDLPEELAGSHCYLVGIKGTGMAALAELLQSRGAHVTGSDVPEVFYTDAILERAQITYHQGFARENLEKDSDCVIYSAAYDPATHPELVDARERGLPILPYNEALGAISRQQPSAAVAGVHGKTTTTALVAAIVERLDLPWSVLAGSALGVNGDRSTLLQGSERFVAETCEYRRHFLTFSAEVAIITNVEADHLDYFADAADIGRAFVEFALRLPEAGTLIYCHDDPGACAVAETVAARRPDLLIRSYGTEPGADVIVELAERQAGSLSFRLGDQRYTLHVPGAHNALNATAAMLVVEELIRRGRGGDEASRPAGGPAAALGVAADRYAAVQSALAAFRGTRRRSEIVGGAAGVLVLDDYAHHPTAIRSTLTGFRSFYPGRRLVVSFMSHTYSRTLALLSDFADALALADVVVLHDIYASAREANPGNVDGTVLADELQSRIGTGAIRAVHYVADPDEAVPLLDSILETGDLFVTMGAGNNWRLGVAWLEASAGEGE
jgi:UDP-N-acetylmuramate--alanine ligase